MKKGYILTVDALMGLIFILVVLLISVSVQVRNNMDNTERAEFKRLHYITEDALEAMNKEGVLDVIGGLWADANGDPNSVEWSNASNITQQYLARLIPDRMGYKLMIDNDTIYNHSSLLPSASSTVETRSMRILTGYTSGKPVMGYVSRAYVAGLRKDREDYLLGWQRTVSSGKNNNHLKITTRFRLPGDMSCNDANLTVVPRAMPNENLSLWINTIQYCEAGPVCEFGKLELTDLCDSFPQGENIIKMEFWDTLNKYEIGKGSGTRLLMDYNTSELSFNITKKFYLDQVESGCEFKQQFSLLMPGDIHNMSLHLKTAGISRVELGFVWKGEICALGNRTPDVNGEVTFSDSDIKTWLASCGSDGIDYGEISGRVYSFNLYMDTAKIPYEYSSDEPECLSPSAKTLSWDSYAEIDYSPIPSGTDLYAYNFMTSAIPLKGVGASCGIDDYGTALEGNYTLPLNALPWVVDVWPAWLYEGDTTYLRQTMTANQNHSVYNHSAPDWDDPFERYMVRFGYSSESNTLIDAGNNSFRAEGEIQSSDGVLNQYCLSEDLSSAAATYLFRSFVDYGGVYRDSDGCKLTIYFDEDPTPLIIQVGEDTTPCEDDKDFDATADALIRLLEQLDWDQDGGVDVKFTADDMSVDSIDQGRVRSMWGPAIFRLVIWI